MKVRNEECKICVSTNYLYLSVLPRFYFSPPGHFFVYFSFFHDAFLGILRVVSPVDNVNDKSIFSQTIFKFNIVLRKQNRV